MSIKDDELLKQLREFVDYAIKDESENRSNAVAALQFLAGDQWPEQIKAQRQLEGRPCLTFNRLPTYLHQVTNDQRQNKPGIHVHPVEGSDVKKAGVVQGMIRHIEYSSNADICYDTAVNSAAAIGWGFWRLITDYESPMSFDQVIKFERLRDSLKCYMSHSVEADGSDMKECAIVRDMTRADFKREHPKEESDIDGCMHAIGANLQAGWISERTVRVVEYYYFEYKKKTICLLEDGSIKLKDELTEFDMVKQERKTHIPQLKLCKATASAVLEQTDIMCQWIPVFPVWGNEIDIQGKVHRTGIIHAAMDPAQMYNYWMTCATEEVSLRPRIPYIGAKGQFEGEEANWARANTSSLAFLEYNPVTVDGTLAPPPQRQPMADVPAGMLQMAVHAADNIKAVTGLYDSSLGARGTATSGVQERAQQRQGDTANFHYTDNLNRSIRHCGRCIIDMLPHYYDGKRIVRIMGADEKIESAEINVPKIDPMTNTVTEVLNDMKVGKYDITSSSGPGYATQREEAAEAMIEAGKSWPQLMEVAGDLVIAAMDWPGAEKMAERVKRSLPANLTADPEDEEGGPPPLPPEIEQHIQQADQHIQELEEALKAAQSGIEKAQIDAASRERVAEINAISKNDVAELTGMIQMLLAQMPPPPGLVDAAMTTGDTQTQSRPAASQAAEQAQNGPTDVMSGS